MRVLDPNRGRRNPDSELYHARSRWPPKPDQNVWHPAITSLQELDEFRLVQIRVVAFGHGSSMVRLEAFDPIGDVGTRHYQVERTTRVHHPKPGILPAESQNSTSPFIRIFSPMEVNSPGPSGVLI